jgi:hypothetical protein
MDAARFGKRSFLASKTSRFAALHLYAVTDIEIWTVEGVEIRRGIGYRPSFTNPGGGSRTRTTDRG